MTGRPYSCRLGLLAAVTPPGSDSRMLLVAPLAAHRKRKKARAVPFHLGMARSRAVSRNEHEAGTSSRTASEAAREPPDDRAESSSLWSPVRSGWRSTRPRKVSPGRGRSAAWRSGSWRSPGISWSVERPSPSELLPRRPRWGAGGSLTLATRPVSGGGGQPVDGSHSATVLEALGCGD